MIQELTDFHYVIDIKPHRINMYDCCQNAIISAFEGLGISSDNIMLSSWGFRFLIDDRLHLGVGNINYMTDLPFIKNVTLTKHEETRVDAIFQGVTEQLKQHKPVLLYQDSFYNPWSLIYGEEHVDHFFVVIGVDANQERFLCIDNYAADDYQVLERKDMEKGGMREYYTIEVGEEVERSREELARYLYDSISEKLCGEETPFSDLLRFSEIENLRWFVDSIDNVELSEAMRKLARIRDMRMGLASDLCGFIGEINLTKYGKQMEESSKLFGRLVVQVVKCKRRPEKQETFLVKMSEIVLAILEKEKECIYGMAEYLKNYFENGGIQ